jgi:hypothetical protein
VSDDLYRTGEVSTMLRLASLLLIPSITTAVITTTWSDLQANPTFSFADYIIEYRNHGKVVCACGTYSSSWCAYGIPKPLRAA